MNKKLLLSLVLFFTFLTNYGQCSFGGTQSGTTQSIIYNRESVSGTNVGTVTFTGVQMGRYVAVNVIQGLTYTISAASNQSFIKRITFFDNNRNAITGGFAVAATNGGNATATNWEAGFTGTLYIRINNNIGCGTSGNNSIITVTYTGGNNKVDSSVTEGTNSWIGHIYDFSNSVSVTPLSDADAFTNSSYLGYFTQANTVTGTTTSFIQNYGGGNTPTFPFVAGGLPQSLYAETFAVRYRMRSTLPAGCYFVKVKGDDGVRLSIDGVKIFDEWKQQGPTEYTNVLVYLNGNSQLVLDYYDKDEANVTEFSIYPAESTINTVNTITNSGPIYRCVGSGSTVLTGSTITYEGGSGNPSIKFQWQSSTNNVDWNDIGGATAKDYTVVSTSPTTTTTVYYRRNIKGVATNTASCVYSSASIAIITSPDGTPLAPTLTPATNIACSQFTANWNTVNLATYYRLDVSTSSVFAAGSYVAGYNDLNVGLVTSYNVTGLANNTTYYYRVRTYNYCQRVTSGNSATSSPVKTGNPVITQPVAKTICEGTDTSFTVGALVSGQTYQWQYSTSATGPTWTNTDGNVGLSGHTNPTLVLTSTPVSYSGYYVRCVVTSVGCSTTSTPVLLTVNPNLAVSVSIAASSSSICAGTPVTFTATPLNGGTAPAYQWKLNGNIVAGNSSATYSSSAFVNGDIISCIVTSNATCATGNPAASNSVTMVVNPNLAVSVSIAASSNSICAGTPVTFTATPLNGGTAPTYQWKLNGNIVAGNSSATYSSSAFVNGDIISCIVTSNATCATGNPAASNSVTMVVNPNLAVSVSIAASSNSICAGTPVTFIATPLNGGTAPTYQWKLNGNVVVGNSSATYSSSTFVNGDIISCIVTSNATCATGNPAASNSVTMVVVANNTITTSGIINTVCSGTQTLTLPYSATTGNPTSYSINWDNAANGKGLGDQGNTPFVFATAGGNLNTIAIPVNLVAGTYTGVMTITNGTCSQTQAVSLTINETPTPPTQGTITAATCAVPTGSVVLNGLPATGTWTIESNPVTTPITGTGTTTTISGLIPNNYTFTVSNATCTSAASANITIPGLVTNTWNGTGWSNGTPTTDQNIIFTGSYPAPTTPNVDINSCSCEIKPNANVVIRSGSTLTVINSVTVASTPTASLKFEDQASLYQKNDNAINTGVITYERLTKTMKDQDYVYWSSPVVGQKFSKLSLGTYSYFAYDIATDNWLHAADNMETGRGYIIKSRNAGPFPYNQTIVFNGVPNNGALTLATPTSTDKYILVGNPYPSALSADDFLVGNKDVLEGTLYFWSRVTALSNDGTKWKYASNDYATYNLTGGVVGSPAGGNASGSGSAKPTGKIGAGQSFFVNAVKGGANVVFKNSMRVAGENTQFYRSSKNNKTTALEKNRVWLNLTNKTGAFKQMLIGYIEGATNDYESIYDGLSYNANAFVDFYSINKDQQFVIQGRALPFKDTDLVPLGYSSTIADSFTIGIDNVDGSFTTQGIYLEDKVIGVIHNLRERDYTFTTAKGTFNDRFVLRYTNKTLGTDEFEIAENTVLVAVENKSIKINTFSQTIDKVFIYDVSGKLIYKKEKVGNPTLAIENLTSSNQVLVVKVVLDNKHVETKKVIF